MKFNKLIPEFGVMDFEKSLKFYTEILGFKVEYSRGERPGEHGFAFMSLEGSQLMIDQIVNPLDKNDKFTTGKLEYPLGRGINFQFEVKKIAPLMESLKKAGYPLQEEPKENWYRQGKYLLGNKTFMVLDPDGYLLRFCEDIGKKKAS